MPDEITQPPPAAFIDGKKTLAPGITFRALSLNEEAALILRADSLGALARFLDSPEGAPQGCFISESKTGSRKIKTGDAAKEWDLGAGWEGALAYCANGWPEGRRGLRAACATLQGEFHPRPPVGFDVAGDWLDIPSAIAGDPESWGFDEEITGRARIVTLAIPLTAPWHVSAETLRNRGAALVSIIDGLEAEGIRCEVDTYSCHEASHNFDQAIIMHRVKEAGAHLSLDRLAASLIHPATFRRIHFAGLENLGEAKVDKPSGEPFKAACLRGGYGGARPMRDDFKPYLDQPGTYHLPLAEDGDFSTPAAAAATIRAQMRDLGFTFKEETK